MSCDVIDCKRCQGSLPNGRDFLQGSPCFPRREWQNTLVCQERSPSTPSPIPKGPYPPTPTPDAPTAVGVAVPAAPPSPLPPDSTAPGSSQRSGISERSFRRCFSILAWKVSRLNIRIITNSFLLTSENLSGDLESVEKILGDIRAPLNFRDSCGYTPLHHTIRNGHEILCKLLLSTEKIDKSDALHAAVDSGRQNIAKLLIEFKFDVNEVSKSGVFGRGDIVFLILKTDSTLIVF